MNASSQQRSSTEFMCTSTTLKAAPFFSALDEAAVRAALPHLRLRTYSARASIAACGSTGDSLCVILSGRVRVMHEDDRGREAVLEELREHEFFNELAWLERRTSAERYEAGTQVTIVHIPRRLVEDWLVCYPRMAQSIVQALAARVAKARRQIASLKLDDVQARVIAVLLERGHEENGEWLVDVGSEFVASLVGASREMVSRVVSDLIRRGLVRRAKRQIIIPDRSAFEALATKMRTSLRLRSNVARPADPLYTSTTQRFAA